MLFRSGVQHGLVSVGGGRMVKSCHPFNFKSLVVFCPKSFRFWWVCVRSGSGIFANDGFMSSLYLHGNIQKFLF